MFTVFLCGYNGFTKFLNLNWISRIVSWQNKTIGCYQQKLIDDDENLMMHRNKRNAIIFDDSCSDHMTGLGAAVMGLFLQRFE